MIPEPKSNSLMRQLADMVKGNEEGRRFKLAGIERDARELISSRVAIAAGWEILAVCSCIRRNADGVRDAYAKGRSAPDRDAFSDLRFAGSFADVGEELKAKDLVMSAVKQWSDDVSILRHSMDILGRCGFLVEAHRVRALLTAQTGEPTSDDDAAIAEWDADEISTPIVFARHFLASRGVSATGALSWNGEGSRGERALICRITVRLEADAAAEEEEQLYFALAEKNYPAESDGRLVIALAPRPNDHGEVVCQ